MWRQKRRPRKPLNAFRTFWVLLAGMLATTSAQAQPTLGGSPPTGVIAAPIGGPLGPPPGRGGPPPMTAEMLHRNADLIAALQLSDEQLDSLRELARSFRTEIHEVRHELAKAHDTLEQAFGAEPLMEDAVWQATHKISDLRGDLLVQEIEYRLQTVQLLTVEQRQQLLRQPLPRGSGRRHRG